MCSITEVSEITPIITSVTDETVAPPPVAPETVVQETVVQETVAPPPVAPAPLAPETVVAATVKESTPPPLPTKEEFTYLRNNTDLTNYALDFMEDEASYYNSMKSYTTEGEVSLFILDNGIVSAAAHFESDGTVDEYLRNDAPHKLYHSIRDWVNDYYNSNVSITKIIDSLHIGEDLVPIWMVLLDAKESYDTNLDSNNTIIPNDKKFTYVALALFGVIVLVASVILPIIVAFV
jgi:hypothetical protein